MKRLLLVMLTVFALFQLACYKDKGNYDYHPVVAPDITGLDTLYTVAIGDTLVVKPNVTTSDPNARLYFSWRLSIPKQLRDTTLTGSTFSYIFNLDPDTYNVRLTITDSSNGMKYFQNFKIRGTTQFSKGTLVLSLENNIGQLSFVKPDQTVLPRIYKALHGVDLPGKPLQVINLFKENINPVPTLGYWVVCGDANDGGVHLSTNTLLQVQTMRSNFFEQPAVAKAGFMKGTNNGVLRGIVNGKVYEGAWQTYYYADTYGVFGAPFKGEGDYDLYPRLAGEGLLLLSYDTKNKQFFVFGNMGILTYIGNNYQVAGTTPFNPKNVSLDLVYLTMTSGVNGYAVHKATDGTLYEMGLQVNFMGFVQMTPLYNRPFPQPTLITPNTKWAGSEISGDVVYFSSGDKIYSYTPSNQQATPLTTNFGGKNVTMLKLINGDKTLIAGVDGTVYWLDVDKGAMGTVIKKMDGIPGAPVDVAESY